MGNTSSSAPKLKRQWTSNKLNRSSSVFRAENDYFARYNERELTLLDRMFQDLARRSPEKTMSKETFLEYFGLPGILGERLFSVFDTKKTNVIDFEEFVTGLARYNRGSMRDKIDMLFELYDLDGQAYVTKEELSIILFSLITPTTALFFGNNGSKPEDTADNKSQAPKQDDDTLSHVSQITRNTVDKLVTEAFEHCDTDNSGKLSKEQFETWVKMNPSVINALETVFVKHVWSGMGADDGVDMTESDAKESIASAHVSSHSLHSIGQQSPRFSAKLGIAPVDQSGSELQRPSLPTAFQPLYNQLQEQYVEDSMRDEHEAYVCTNCKAKYYKSMYVDDKSDPEYAKFVLFKQQAPGSDTNSLDLAASTMSPASSANKSNKSNNGNASQSLKSGKSDVIGRSASMNAASGDSKESKDSGSSASSRPRLGKVASSKLRLSSKLKGSNNSSRKNSTESSASPGRSSMSVLNSRQSRSSRLKGSKSSKSPQNLKNGNKAKQSSPMPQLQEMAPNGQKSAPNASAATSNSSMDALASICPVLPANGDDAANTANAANGANPEGPQQIALKFCPQCGGKLVEATVKMAINLQSAMALTQNMQQEEFRKVGKSGMLHKLGATFHAWVTRNYVIKDKFLYSFKKRDDETPTNVMFISGWFIAARDDEHLKKGYYGIELQPPHTGDGPKDGVDADGAAPVSAAASNQASGHVASQSTGNVLGATSSEQPQAKMLYAKSAAERDEWVAALQSAASTLAIQNYYHIGKVLGKGHFSVVHLGTHKKTNQQYAIKIVEKKRIDAREKMALRNEIAIMKLVNHPCIIQMEDVFEDKKCIYMVMTLVEHGDFFGRWQSKKNFKEDTIRIIIWKLLDALHYLHNLGIVHRDLKPENILCPDEFDDTQLLISDFGLSKFAAPHTEMTMSCGTLAYVAPEVLKQKGYSWKVDMWSLGCIMHLLIRNVLPFDGRTKEQVIERTLNKKLDLVTKPIWKEISTEAKDLLAKLLQKDPNNRIDLKSAMEHSWFDALRNNSKYALHAKVSADLIALTTNKSVPNSPLNSGNNSAQAAVEIVEVAAKVEANDNIAIPNSGTSDADDKFVMVDDSLKQ